MKSHLALLISNLQYYIFLCTYTRALSSLIVGSRIPVWALVFAAKEVLSMILNIVEECLMLQKVISFTVGSKTGQVNGVLMPDSARSLKSRQKIHWKSGSLERRLSHRMFSLNVNISGRLFNSAFAKTLIFIKGILLPSRDIPHFSLAEGASLCDSPNLCSINAIVSYTLNPRRFHDIRQHLTKELHNVSIHLLEL